MTRRNPPQKETPRDRAWSALGKISYWNIKYEDFYGDFRADEIIQPSLDVLASALVEWMNLDLSGAEPLDEVLATLGVEDDLVETAARFIELIESAQYHGGGLSREDGTEAEALRQRLADDLEALLTRLEQKKRSCLMLEPLEMDSLHQTLAKHGLSLQGLQREAQAVVLFGSRAAGCARPTSDWDLLCIGAGRSKKRGGLDLVWVEPTAIETSTWLGGDLSGHVATHGLWLSGNPCWNLDAIDFATAARRKEARLVRSLHALIPVWSFLGPPYQKKHASLVRRDAQRWLLLQRGQPIPPSAVLDEQWTGEDSSTWFTDMLRSLGAEPRLALALSATAASTAVR